MESKELKITHSLLHSWHYATSPDATEQQWDSFLSSLRREPITDTSAMQDGRLFELMCNAAANGLPVECDNAEWLKAAQKYGTRIKGAVQQVYIEATKQIGGNRYRLVGVADAVRAGQVFDIKKVVRYEYGKYADSTQHPMYFELMPGATRFDYLIFDGKMCYNETYRRGDFTPIEITIAEFEQFLKAQNLWNDYKKYWEVK